MIKIEVNHFSDLKLIYDIPLDLIMDIPGKYLKKGDLIYAMTYEKYIWGPDETFDWFPGHCGLYLGTETKDSFDNNGRTTIESSPWKDKPDGVQFSDFSHFKGVNYHLYMGARRYNGSLSDDNRTKIAGYAIDKIGHGWSKIGEGNIIEGSYSCVGMTEASYDDAGKSIIEPVFEFPFITPIEQYKLTIPVNEITLESGVLEMIPVRGIVWDEANNEYTDNPSKYILSVSNKPPGSTFRDNILTWTPEHADVGNSYTISFTATANVGDESYTRIQSLIINVEQGKSSETGIVTDIDGNTYQTIKIGNQWWMAENLKVTHYRNGDAIPNVTDYTEWVYLTSGAYCAYDNDNSHVATYGRLYNWYAVSDSRNVAPSGWHVSTFEEWQTLEDYLGGSSVAGGKLKEAGTSHWASPNTGATNESGFSALPSGYRSHVYGHYSAMGFYCDFWTSTENVAPYWLHRDVYTGLQ